MKFKWLKMGGLTLLLAGSASGQTQSPIGTVGMQDATVAGALEITNGRAVMVGSTTVTAHDHTAEVALSRGGSVRVCATSGLHVAEGNSAAGEPNSNEPLMLALDRGAIEVKMAATPRDVVMTPDLRFTANSDGPLELNLRVAKNGDTCVENRGANAPVLHVADPFGAGTYELHAGQHVLFEHASLKEVVDHESSSCGCPPDVVPEPTMNVADALVKSGGDGAKGQAAPAKTAEEQHPFPAAVSEGLAPVAAIPQAPAGALHSQVSATLSSSGSSDSTAIPPPPPPEKPVAAMAAATSASIPADGGAATTPALQPAPPQKRGVFHAVGRFFRRVFGPG